MYPSIKYVSSWTNVKPNLGNLYYNIISDENELRYNIYYIKTQIHIVQRILECTLL